MLRVRSLSQNFWTKEPSPSRRTLWEFESKAQVAKKLRDFVINKKTQKHLDIILHVFQGHLKQPNLYSETN